MGRDERNCLESGFLPCQGCRRSQLHTMVMSFWAVCWVSRNIEDDAFNRDERRLGGVGSWLGGVSALQTFGCLQLFKGRAAFLSYRHNYPVPRK